VRGASWKGLICTLKSVCQRAVEKRVKTIRLLRQIETVRLPNHETLQHTASVLHCDGLRMKFQERLVLKNVGGNPHLFVSLEICHDGFVTVTLLLTEDV
jgi:hypothetical protein